MCLVPIKIRVGDSKKYVAKRKKALRGGKMRPNAYLGRRHFAVAECKHGTVVCYVYDPDGDCEGRWWYFGITNPQTQGWLFAPPQILTDYVYKTCGEGVSEEEFHLPWRKCLAEHAYGVSHDRR